ncbi:contractile injection system tape measure protein [Spartinivicinus ruber]|uniref:contractile injection system tape measure protein n=1 Tax=Spartinivicinus ruber TaxID=2683272 RepID=UPI0013D2A8D1|nr:contractile injection system tape measure protein [Spartinivicinus ruber]
MIKHACGDQNRVGCFNCKVSYNGFTQLPQVDKLDKQLKYYLNQELGRWLEEALHQLNPSLLTKQLKKKVAIKRLTVQLPIILYSHSQTPHKWLLQFKRHLQQQFVQALTHHLQNQQNNTDNSVELNGLMSVRPVINQTDANSPQGDHSLNYPQTTISSRLPDQLLAWFEELLALEYPQQQQSLNTTLSLWNQQPELVKPWLNLLNKLPNIAEQWCQLLSDEQCQQFFMLVAPHSYPMASQLIAALMPVCELLLNKNTKQSVVNHPSLKSPSDKPNQEEPFSLWAIFLAKQLEQYKERETGKHSSVSDSYTKMLSLLVNKLDSRQFDFTFLSVHLLDNWLNPISYQRKKYSWNLLKLLLIQLKTKKQIFFSNKVGVEKRNSSSKLFSNTIYNRYYFGQQAGLAIQQLLEKQFNLINKNKKKAADTRQFERGCKQQPVNSKFHDGVVKWLWLKQLQYDWAKSVRLISQQGSQNSTSDNTNDVYKVVKETNHSDHVKNIKYNQDEACQITQDNLKETYIQSHSQQLKDTINLLSTSQLQQLFDGIDLANKWDIYQQVLSEYDRDVNQSTESKVDIEYYVNSLASHKAIDRLPDAGEFWHKLFTALDDHSKFKPIKRPPVDQKVHTNINTLSYFSSSESLYCLMASSLDKILTQTAQRGEAYRKDWYRWVNDYCLLLSQQLSQSLQDKLLKNYLTNYDSILHSKKVANSNYSMDKKSFISEADKRDLVYILFPQLASWLLLHHDIAVDLLINHLEVNLKSTVEQLPIESIKVQLTHLSRESILMGQTLSKSLTIFFRQAELAIQQWQQQLNKTSSLNREKYPEVDNNLDHYQMKKQAIVLSKKQLELDSSSIQLRSKTDSFNQNFTINVGEQFTLTHKYYRKLLRQIGQKITSTLPGYLKNYFISQSSPGYTSINDSIDQPLKKNTLANILIRYPDNGKVYESIDKKQYCVVSDREINEILATFKRAVLAQHNQLFYQNSTRLLYQFLLQTAPARLSYCLLQRLKEPKSLDYLLGILPIALKNSLVILLRPHDGYLLLIFIHWLVVTLETLINVHDGLSFERNAEGAIENFSNDWEKYHDRRHQCWLVIQYWVFNQRSLLVEKDIPELLTLLLPEVSQQTKNWLQQALINQWYCSTASADLHKATSQKLSANKQPITNRKHVKARVNIDVKENVTQLAQQQAKTLYQLCNNSWQENVKLIASLSCQDCFNLLLQLRPFDGLTIFNDTIKLIQQLQQENINTEFIYSNQTTGLSCKAWALLWCAIGNQIRTEKPAIEQVKHPYSHHKLIAEAFDRNYFAKLYRQHLSKQTGDDKLSTKQKIAEQTFQPLAVIAQLLNRLVPLTQVQYQQIRLLTTQVLEGNLQGLVQCFEESPGWLQSWMLLMSESQWQALVMRLRPDDGVSIQVYSGAVLNQLGCWLETLYYKQLNAKSRKKLLQRAKQMTRQWLMEFYLQAHQRLEPVSLVKSWLEYLTPLYDEIVHLNGSPKQLTSQTAATTIAGLADSSLAFADELLNLPDKASAVWKQLKSYFMSSEVLLLEWMDDVENQHYKLTQQKLTKSTIKTVSVEQMVSQPEAWLNQPIDLIQQQLAEYLRSQANLERIAEEFDMVWFEQLVLQIRPSEYLSLLVYASLIVDCVLIEEEMVKTVASENADKSQLELTVGSSTSRKISDHAAYCLKWLVLSQWLKPQQLFKYPQSLIEAYQLLVEKCGLVTNGKNLNYPDQAYQREIVGMNDRRFWGYRLSQQLKQHQDQLCNNRKSNNNLAFSVYIEPDAQPALIAALQYACLDKAPLDSSVDVPSAILDRNNNVTVQLDKDKPILVENAGLVIVSCYLERLFGQLNWQAKGAFNNTEAAEKAVALLQYMVSPDWQQPEYHLTLNKILCGIPLDAPLTETASLTEQDCAIADSLLKAVINHWRVLGNTTVEGLQTSFLQRVGWLVYTEKHWQLRVEVKAYDMLLDQLPWSIKTHKLPWMEAPLIVDWRDK